MNRDEPLRDHDRLIEAMRQQIRATPMPPARRAALLRPASAVGRVRYLGWLVAGAVALVAAMVALALALSLVGGATPPPAYAATLNPDRTVTITLREMADIPKLNAKLAALGTRIRVVPVLPGCVALVHVVSNGKVVPAPAQTLHASRTTGSIVSMTIEVKTLPGRTLVIADTRKGLYALGVVVVGRSASSIAIIAAAGEARKHATTSGALALGSGRSSRAQARRAISTTKVRSSSLPDRTCYIPRRYRRRARGGARRSQTGTINRRALGRGRLDR
ncbi:MAG: hypothetical protein ACLP8S_17740 [Solirubrobacteraceae bacterium]